MKKSITALLIAAALTVPCLAAATNWGLSFPTPGDQPKGMAGSEELLKNNAYFVGAPEEKNVYLTFDAGFENGNTPAILDTLKKTGVPAAFFLVGTYIRDNPQLVLRMVDEGHIVANHTMSHPDMSGISDKASFEKELSQVEVIYKNLIGRDMPAYYRPPRGIYSTENLKMAKALGYKTVFWSLAYVDWYVNKQPTRDQAFSKLIPRAHPGMVLLLHSTSATNAQILEELIGKYREMGYVFRTLDELTATAD
ncbi:MAG: polysaccharide deacetylase family protein [Oscillospiraceae bacterium]|jgi:peptidoglycan-N-acetylmuramic acid deacetylase|nr:polysaccharide deacetylase family protein [Oscillospiraceae bacterium]